MDNERKQNQIIQTINYYLKRTFLVAMALFGIAAVAIGGFAYSNHLDSVRRKAEESLVQVTASARSNLCGSGMIEVRVMNGSEKTVQSVRAHVEGRYPGHSNVVLSELYDPDNIIPPKGGFSNCYYNREKNVAAERLNLNVSYVDVYFAPKPD